jgi:hypothetical protein
MISKPNQTNNEKNYYNYLDCITARKRMTCIQKRVDYDYLSNSPFNPSI